MYYIGKKVTKVLMVRDSALIKQVVRGGNAKFLIWSFG